MKLFTVDRLNSLQKNVVLTLTELDTSMPYLTMDGLFSDADLQEHLQTIFVGGLSAHGWKYAKERHTYGESPHFSHNVSCLAEMNLEYVRKAYFPDKPSRFQSMFACGSIEDAKMFKERFGATSSKIYEIEAHESLKVDMSLIFLGTQNVTGSFLAHKYWRGESGSDPFWEHIVKLPAQVLREVS